MRKFFTLTSAAVVFASIALTGCVGGPAGPGEGSLDGNLPYPDSGYADAETDSWKQIGEDEGDITIEWYVDSTGYSINTNILNAIYENTGIRVEVSYPATDNSDRLATMIAGDMLPDIIMITDDTVKAQLEEEGYIYSINRLAEKYAPTLLDRISETEFDYYAASDGNLYTLSNNFYTDEAVDAYSEQGKTLLVNGCFNVRKDYLIAYLEHKYGVSSTDDDFWTQAYQETTTPSGFIEMCVWVKQNYNIANNIPLAVIDSNTVSRLQEYFCVPMEDEQGDLLYAYEQAECKEAYMFLNELYRNNILISGSLSANSSTTGNYIAQGYPFFTMVTTQNFINQFNTAYQNGYEYVPVVITNSAGDAPLLRNLAGYGYRMTMITKNCEHVDRVIKMLDYLRSIEGQQSLYYGTEGETFEYTIRPGETVDGVTYENGQIKYTDAVLQAIADSNYAQYNIRNMSPIYDPMYARLTSAVPEECVTFNNYLLYNLKAAVNPYTYNKSIMDYTYDTSASNYVRMVNLKSTLEKLWTDNFAEIITQSSAQEASAKYDEILASARAYGLQTYMEYQNASFRAYKRKFGIEGCGWIKNLDSYTEPEVKLLGDVSQNIEIPSRLYP